MRTRTRRSNRKKRGAGLLAAGAIALLLTPGRHAQQPVTGGEDLIAHVRALKSLGGRVHLEWLYLEDNLDGRPEQRELVRGGRPLEFTEGRLYHGRGGLDDVLLSEWIPGESYLTRAPHVWAVGPFRKSIRGPAIFMIDAPEFNRLRDSGQAVLEAEVDRNAGIMDPYPKIKAGFPLDIVIEIWIDQDTAERYQRLLERGGAGLSPAESALKNRLRRLREAGRLKLIPGLRHGRLDDTTFYPAAYETVGAYFTGRRLTERMPRFRLRDPDRDR